MADIRPVAAPNLPLAPKDYDRKWQEQFSNALRLYFTALNNAVNQTLIRYEKTTTSVAATSVSTSVGTPTGTVANVQTMLDGSVYSVVEAAASPAMTVDFSWAGITETPYELVIRVRYDGTSSHNLRVELYNYLTLSFVAFHAIPTGLEYSVFCIALPVMTNFLSGGVARVRFDHVSSGNPAHTLYIDYIAFNTR